jgi:hypothetical protein
MSLRTLINACVLVMLILQGVAQASVDVQPHSSSLHCADHDAEKTDCPCCGDNWLGMAGSCATSCAASVATAQQTFDVPPALPQSHQAAAFHWQPGPSYLPLNPPPIA